VRRHGEDDRHFLGRLEEFACLRYAARLVRQGADAHVHAAQLLAREFGVELEEDVPSDDNSSENSDSDAGEDLEGGSEEDAEDDDSEGELENDPDAASSNNASDSDSDDDKAKAARRWPRLQPGGCQW
jgi:hypothetical protein